MLGALYKINSEISLFLVRTRLKLKNPTTKWLEGGSINGGIDIYIHKSSKLVIGENVKFNSASKYNMVGVNKKVSIGVGERAQLIIGNNCGFSGTSIYSAESIVIGDNCNFGGNTFIWDTDFHPLNFEERRVHNVKKINTNPIVIGNDVFVGANSIILKGVCIGDRAIIGAGSVVTTSILADEVWAGNPARKIR